MTAQPKQLEKSAQLSRLAAPETAGIREGKERTKPADAIALLKTDHRKVEDHFKKFQKAPRARKAGIVKAICTELKIHTIIEEEIFYPACREKGVQAALLDEAQVEHDGAKLLIQELESAQPDAAYYDAKVKVLCAYVTQHVREEEQRGGIFADAKKKDVDLAAVGARLKARKDELEAGAKADRLHPLSMPSRNATQTTSQENATMPRLISDRDRSTQSGDNRNRNRSRSSSDFNDDDCGSRNFSQDRDGRAQQSGRYANQRYGMEAQSERDEASRGRSNRDWESDRDRDHDMDQNRYSRSDYSHRQDWDTQRDNQRSYQSQGRGRSQNGDDMRDEDYGRTRDAGNSSRGYGSSENYSGGGYQAENFGSRSQRGDDERWNQNRNRSSRSGQSDQYGESQYGSSQQGQQAGSRNPYDTQQGSRSRHAYGQQDDSRDRGRSSSRGSRDTGRDADWQDYD